MDMATRHQNVGVLSTVTEIYITRQYLISSTGDREVIHFCIPSNITKSITKTKILVQMKKLRHLQSYILAYRCCFCFVSFTIQYINFRV